MQLDQEVSLALGLTRRREGLNPVRLSHAINAGLPYTAFERGMRAIPEFTKDLMYLIVPRTTLARRETSRRLSADESNRLVRAMRVWIRAMHVWKDAAEAKSFLFRPHPLLERRRPFDLTIESDVGATLVLEVLGRLEHGTAA